MCVCACVCFTGYYGATHGPCTCQASSNRFLQVQIDSSMLNTTGAVNISILNTSSGALCGDGGEGWYVDMCGVYVKRIQYGNSVNISLLADSCVALIGDSVEII